MSRYKQELLFQTCSENIYCKNILMIMINNKVLSTCHRKCLTRTIINSLTDRISSAWTSTSWSALERLVNHAAFATPLRQHLHWFFRLFSWTCSLTSYHDASCGTWNVPCGDQFGAVHRFQRAFSSPQHFWQQRIDTSHKKNFPNNGRPQCGREGLWHS